MQTLPLQEKREILERLNELAILKFRKFVEDGGESIKQDRMYKQSKTPIVNVGFDTEDNSKGHCHLLIFFDGENYYEFTDKESALFWLVFSEWDKHRCLIWCVNTDYDLNNLCYEYEYLIERFYNKSRLIFAKVVFNNNVRFYDLINFYSLSAKAVGALFGLKKLEFDVTKQRRTRKDGTRIVTKTEIKYCKRDTKISQVAGEFITKKFDEFGIKQTATVASCALQIYLTHYDKVKFTQFNRNRYIVDNNEIMKCYYGGRTEAFFYGRLKSANIKYFDVNSLYPFVMRKYLFPNPFSEVQRTRKRNIANGVICCQVNVPKRKNNIPALPLRHNGKLVFPIGRFTGYWVIDELNYACDNLGVTVEKVLWSYEWAECEDLFSEFVTDFWNLRHNSKTKADSKFFKVIMNSLYGKFAEKRRITKYVALEYANQFDPIVFDQYAMQTEEYLPFHNNTIISAYVTAYARLELHRLLLLVESKGGRVLYCDTDSIIYDGKFDLPTGDELGQLKKEDDIKDVEILGAKYYRYQNKKGDWHYVCKGVPKYMQHRMFIGKRQAEYQRPIRFRESIRRKLQANVWYLYTKKSLTTFDKRTILEDGNTKPLMLKER